MTSRKWPFLIWMKASRNRVSRVYLLETFTSEAQTLLYVLVLECAFDHTATSLGCTVCTLRDMSDSAHGPSARVEPG